jgi:hypothetical protein
MVNKDYQAWQWHTCGIPEQGKFRDFLVGLRLDADGNPAGVRVERGRHVWEFQPGWNRIKGGER